MTRFGFEDVFDPVSSVNVGMFVDVEHAKSGSPSGSQCRGLNAQPPCERLKGVELVWFNHTGIQFIVGRHLVSLSAAVVMRHSKSSGAIHIYPGKKTETPDVSRAVHSSTQIKTYSKSPFSQNGRRVNGAASKNNGRPLQVQLTEETAI